MKAFRLGVALREMPRWRSVFDIRVLLDGLFGEDRARRGCLALLAALVLLAFPQSRLAAEAPLDVGSRRELFVDGAVLDRLIGAARVELGRPQPQEVALVHDAPWEGSISIYHSVFRDRDRLRMYYRGQNYGPDETGKWREGTQVSCYAESQDGIRWSKPELDLFEHGGSRRNNIVWPDAHNFMPFRDARPDCPPEERYKANAGRTGFVSADGLRWRKLDKPLNVSGVFDSLNVAFYDPQRGKYLFFFRDFRDGVRDIRFATSDDFRTWSREQPFLDYGDAPSEHLYTNAIEPYVRAPHILIGLPMRHMHDRQGTPADTVLMSSRDALHWHRWREAFLRPGQTPSRWSHRNGYVARGITVTKNAATRQEELSLYAIEDYQWGVPAKLRRYTLRLDGFASIHATAKGGEAITKPLRFDGQQLELNYATSAAGSVRVEIQDEQGTPVPGFRLEDCSETWGDHLDRVWTWKDGSSVASLHGKIIRLRFVLRDADLYSFRFRR